MKSKKPKIQKGLKVQTNEMKMKLEIINLRQALTWALSDDTGISSKEMVAKAFGLKPKRDLHFGGYPHDGGDRGRCVRALAAIPSAVEGLAKLEKSNPEWAKAGALIRQESKSIK